MTQMTDVRCSNCNRKGGNLDVFRVCRDELRGKQSKSYYFIPKRSRRRNSNDNYTWLCRCCKYYLLGSSSDAVDYWPAMVFCFLSHTNSASTVEVTLEKKWSMIPHTWRNWWEEWIVEYHGSIPDNEPIFCDVTNQLNEMQDSIVSLEWVRLAKNMDMHLAYPEIRCPWGCSEFIHKTNRLKLKDFLWYITGYEMQCYQAPKGRHWTDCISPTFPSTCLILDKFLCNPAIAMTHDGPVILCCRDHSESSIKAYLHVPESPTGVLFTPNANSFAPVAIRSRTNRHFKPHVFSDTFCTVKQVGGFGGIDSSYVTSGNVALRCDSISIDRDFLAIQGRPDIKSQIFDRCTERKTSRSYMPRETVQRLIRSSERAYPDPSTLKEFHSGTYVPCETAVKLQEMMYGESSKVIKVYSDDSSAQYCTKAFVPPWPTHFVRVHSMNGHGERFHKTKNPDLGIWLLLCITGCVPEVWEALACSVDNNRSWEGHWLRFASTNLHFRGHQTSSKHFPALKNIKKIFNEPLEEILNDERKTKDMFRACENIEVVEGPLTELSDSLLYKSTVICINPTAQEMSHNLENIFELRCLVCAGGDFDESDKRKMFVKHSGQKFWVQHGTNFPHKYNGNSLQDDAFDGARIAVYCRKTGSTLESLQRRYLSAIGGQDGVYCEIHRLPLVLNHQRQKNTSENNIYRCVCTEKHDECRLHCTRFAAYICPIDGCCTAVCNWHLSTIQADLNEGDPESVCYVSKNDSRIARHHVEGTGGIRLCVDPMLQRLPPEALGPTAGHETAQDIVLDCDMEDASQTTSEDQSISTVDDKEVMTASSERSNDSVEWNNCESNEDESITNSQKNDGDNTWYLIGQNDTHQEDDHFDATGILTTATGIEQREILIENIGNDGINMPTCVLLNQHGHLLTRTNHKLRMNKSHRAMCERIVSKNQSRVIPLVYAEAQLFPTIFWVSLPDGAIAGAVPTALWTDRTTLNRIGFASMREHAKMRITNPALPTSVDPAYHFLLLDQLTNLGARGKHTKMVLQRGFADHQKKDGVSFRDKSDSAELFGESSENHANVHKLSALVRERRPHYFFTQTCNQKTSRGLHILREWVTSNEAVDLLCKKYKLTCDEARYYLRESAASYVSRSWNEVADLWMRYIIYSKDEPLGPIEYAWYRKEFQDTQGNLSHIHSILRTRYNVENPAELKIVLNKIRGCIQELVHHDEYLRMKEHGIISSFDHLLNILEQAQKYLPHCCHTRCQIPKMTPEGTTLYICKVKDNYYRTATPYAHTIEPNRVSHIAEAAQIYTKLGMIVDGRIEEECLQSEYHVPICSRDCPKFSPTSGDLFVKFPSSQNLQYTTGRMISDYLVKYVTKIDDVARADIRPPTLYDRERARAEIEQLHNTKITSNKIAAQKSLKPGSNYGRLVTHTECLSVVLGENLVTSSVDFVHFSTAPREYRQAFFKRSTLNPRNVPNHITCGNANVNFEIRGARNFPPHRWFSPYQEKVVLDERESQLSIDSVTIFSIRPPELRFVNQLPLYFKWFERRNMTFTQDNLDDEIFLRVTLDISTCHWIDGLNMQIVLRRGAVTDIVAYATECGDELFGGRRHKRRMLEHLQQIEKLQLQFGERNDRNVEITDTSTRRQRTVETSRQQFEQLAFSFLSSNPTTKLPIPWTTPVFPKNRGRFLIYILLLMGKFETEYGLMNHSSMKEAYVEAGLFDPNNEEESIKSLLKQYVRECLACQCGSVYLHDRNLIFANAAFRECLMDTEDELVLGTPCVLQASMKDETTEKINKERHRLFKSFIGALYTDLYNSGFTDSVLPDKTTLESIHCDNPQILLDTGINNDIAGTVEYPFPPEFNTEGVQSLPSYDEQFLILNTAKNTINRYIHGKSHKNIVVCGGPGNGKTTVCEEICLYAFSRGLRGIATSIVADRSKTLGGMHIHLLCAIPISERSNMSPGRTAEAALGCLYRKPELLHFWRQLQFLYIDELGAVSAELLATMDIIARSIKDSTRFMGGILIIASMDVHQLLPIDGTALMLSMNMMCEFNFSELKESVRAARDANLRHLCNLTRTDRWTDEKRKEFKRILSDNCNFVSSFDDPAIPEDGIYVFGRRAPCQRIEELLIKRLKADKNTELVLSRAQDEESSVAGNWKPASAPVSQELSRKEKRKVDLYLFEKGRYEFTYNLQGSFQQGQLAILLSVSQDDVDNHRSIQLYKGPSGCKEFPPLAFFNKTYLEANGWEPVMVPYETSKPQRVFGKIIGRRTQYGVRLRIASTIHACQGSKCFYKLVKTSLYT